MGESFQPDRTGVVHVVKCFRDGRISNLARPRLTAARHIRHLNFPDIRQAATQKGNKIPLPDLSMVEVQHQAQIGMVDGLDQGQVILRFRKRHAGMVNGGIEVFQHESDVMLRALIHISGVTTGTGVTGSPVGPRPVP